MVEGTPLLREHTPKKCIEGSNPSLSAKYDKWAVLCFLTLYGRSGLRYRDLRTLHPGFACPRHSRRTRTWLAVSDHREEIDQAAGARL